MYQQRTALIAFGTACLGTILLSIGVFTPGWRITYTDTGDSTSGGLWSVVVCHGEECKTVTFYEKYKQALEEDPESSEGTTYAVTAGQQTEAVLSVTACIVSCILSFLIYKNHSHKERLALLTICLLLVSGSLIWRIIGAVASVLVQAAYLRDEDSSYIIGSPYSLLTSAFGSLLTLVVVFINFISLWTVKEDQIMHFAYGQFHNEAPVIHLNMEIQPTNEIS